MCKPLAIDLYCGLGGWSESILAEGWHVIGFDIERHVYGEKRYPAQLVIQDVLTLHGSQFRSAQLIVASPPCQAFSYMAMPWSRAKAQAAAIEADKSGQMRADLTRLFDACFRIQREACEAAGRHIPLIVENVMGAQRWVGRAKWRFGSYYLWGDVPALMPIPQKAGRKVPGFRFDGSKKYFQQVAADQAMAAEGFKTTGMNWSDQSRRGQDFTRIAGMQAQTTADHRRALGIEDGIKQGGTWFHDDDSIIRRSSSKSVKRKEASALIAKIPPPLGRHIAKVFKPVSAT